MPFSRLLALNKKEWPFLLSGMVGSAAVGGAQPGFAFLISAVTTNFFIQGRSLHAERTAVQACLQVAEWLEPGLARPGHVIGLKLVSATRLRCDEVTHWLASLACTYACQQLLQLVCHEPVAARHHMASMFQCSLNVLSGCRWWAAAVNRQLLQLDVLHHCVWCVPGNGGSAVVIRSHGCCIVTACEADAVQVHPEARHWVSTTNRYCRQQTSLFRPSVGRLAAMHLTGVRCSAYHDRHEAQYACCCQTCWHKACVLAWWLCRWFDKDENSSGKLASSLSTDAAVIRGAVGDVFGMVVQNLACMAAGKHNA